MQHFKELLRSIRFEIDQELKGDKVLAITSLGSGEGKTLLATSLAYSYAAINKKVLLIDGNFHNPAISETLQPKLFVEDYFRSSSYIERDNDNAISVLGNRGSDVTLLEINDEKNIQTEFNELKSRYDIILIDLPPLDSLNQSKEWLLFSNKAIAVFEANKSVSKSQGQYIDYLKNLNTKFAGWVLNKTAAGNHSKKAKQLNQACNCGYEVHFKFIRCIVTMKIEHRKKAADPFKDLSPLQRRCLTAAIILAFAGIFVWFLKILFF